MKPPARVLPFAVKKRPAPAPRKSPSIIDRPAGLRITIEQPGKAPTT
jgi:hypothetical protein